MHNSGHEAGRINAVAKFDCRKQSDVLSLTIEVTLEKRSASNRWDTVASSGGKYLTNKVDFKEASASLACSSGTYRAKARIDVKAIIKIGSSKVRYSSGQDVYSVHLTPIECGSGSGGGGGGGGSW